MANAVASDLDPARFPFSLAASQRGPVPVGIALRHPVEFLRWRAAEMFREAPTWLEIGSAIVALFYALGRLSSLHVAWPSLDRIDLSVTPLLWVAISAGGGLFQIVAVLLRNAPLRIAANAGYITWAYVVVFYAWSAIPFDPLLMGFLGTIILPFAAILHHARRP